MTEFTKDNISAWRIWGEPPGYVEESLDEIERLQQRIAELEEALTKIASYESMRFKLSPYEYGLLEQIVGIAEHALRDGE